MVTKVGSAGQVLESVIQYQNSSAKPENGSKGKGEAGQDRHVKANKSPDRVITASEIQKGAIRAPKSLNKDASQDASALGREAMAVLNSEAQSEHELVKKDASAMELSQEAVKITVDDVNKKLAPTGSSVQFSYHEKTGRYSFTVLDSEGNVVREVPPEKSLDMVAKMFEMAGILVDEKL